MCIFAADYDRANGSPDRMDALVWGLSFLFDKMTGRKQKEQKEEVDKPRYINQQNNVYRGHSDTSWMAG
jgi:hypothetical protein